MMYRITVRETGESFPCQSNEFVLAAMIRSRRGPVVHGCCGGGCGVCRMRIDSGEYEKIKRMSRAHVSEEEEKTGLVLLCCIQPRSDLVVSKAGRDLADSKAI
ncbi:MAG: 2Fe-2S iron-sulfur cluster binding domain-containing protein [Gracilibacteraceae bacterium]|jgi:ferredoxin|nr:2Fe-2S iron-sulfur cluster binding domain-containing protein [Gracilibacteraceae bacterium]